MDRKAALNVLSKPLAQEMLQTMSVARMGYIGADGYPRVIPIGFLWKNSTFIVCTASNAPKVRAIQSKPRIGLTIDRETQPPHIVLVRGTATVEILNGVPPEYLEASHKYIPREEWKGFEEQVRALYKEMARITITPEWAKLIDFETTLPSAVEELVLQQAG